MFISISNQATEEIVEKKSKFISNMCYVKSKEDAENKIKEIKKKYFDARHNCSAYRVLDGEQIVERSSDDGEPAGTAGAPMLNFLQKNNLCNVLVVVTRYFGGILLGTGGLVRAYSEATLKAFDAANKVSIYPGKEFEVKIDYQNLENIKYYCRKNEFIISDIKYLNEIVCKIEIKNEDIQKFLEDIDKRLINVLECREIQGKYIQK